MAPRLGRGPDLPLNLPLAAAVIAISLRHIPESSSPGLSRGDWPGALFAALGLGGLVTGLIESASLGWAHPLVFGSLVGGVVALIVFMRVEASSVAPMVPLNLFASATFSGANLLTLFLYSAIGIFFFLFPLNLIQVQRYSATSAGAAALPFILLMFILSRWSGGLVKRCGPRRPLLIGPLIAASGFVLLAMTSAGGSYWKTIGPCSWVGNGGHGSSSDHGRDEFSRPGLSRHGLWHQQCRRTCCWGTCHCGLGDGDGDRL